MGLGKFINGRHQPITPYAGSWAESCKTPLREDQKPEDKAVYLNQKKGAA